MAVDLVTVGTKRTEDGDLSIDPDEQLTAAELNAIVVALNAGIAAGNDNETIIADLRTSLGLTGPLAVPGDETVTAAIDRIDAALAGLSEIDDGVTSSDSSWSSQKVQTEIAAAVAALVDAIATARTDFESADVTHAAGIATNAAGIATNATDIATARTDFEAADVTHAAGIATNTTDIATARTDFEAADVTHAAGIATNAAGIATNATDIATARTDFEAADVTHAAGIATNAAGIATNATDIATARTDFEAADVTHAADIATNAAGIATNTADIATARTDFEAADVTHAANIATNTADIATARTDFEAADVALAADISESVKNVVSYLKLSNGSVNPDAISAALDVAEKTITTRSFFPPADYVDGLARGGATYEVVDYTSGADGYSLIDIGSGKALSLVWTNTLLGGWFGLKGSQNVLEQSNMEAMIAVAVTRTVLEAANSWRPAVTIVIERGLVGVANIEIPGGIQVHMMGGARFYGRHSAPFDPLKPFVTIGDPEVNTNLAEDKNLAFDCLFHTGIARKNYTGIRLLNRRKSRISIGRMSGCARLIEFAGSGLGQFAYNIIHGGDFQYFTYAANFTSYPGAVGGSQAGWCNANSWYTPGFQPSSSMNLEGSSYAIVFSSNGGAYNGQNGMVIDAPSFEMAASSYAYPASTAVVQYARFNVDGREYEADTAMTLPATAPSHLSGSVGGITFISSQYRRSPVFFQGSGAFAIIRDSRWEGGYGEAIVKTLDVPNPNLGTGADVVASFNFADPLTLAPNQGLCYINLAPEGIARVYDGSVTMSKYAAAKAQNVTADNLHESFIYSSESAAWHSSRVPIYRIAGTQYDPGLIADKPGSIVMYKNFIESNDGNIIIGFPIDASIHSGFVVSKTDWASGSGDRGTLHGLDSSLNVLPQTSLSDRVVAFSAPSSVYTSNCITSGGAMPTGYVAAKAQNKGVHYILATWRAFRFSDFTIEAARTALNTPLFKVRVEKVKGVHPSVTVRSSKGAPTYGYFPRTREVIECSLNNDSRYWQVTTSGIIAPNWATATAYKAGQLATNAGHTYAAVGAGTSGATAPVHTSGTVSDGTVSWEWIAPVAVIALGA